MLLVRIIAAIALLAGSAVARAENAPPRSYAVLSLVGDALVLHVHRHQVGSRTESSPSEVNAVDNPIFDEVAIIAARGAMLRLLPAARLQLMTTQDKGLYRAQNEMFDHPEAHHEDREFLKTLLKEQGVTHALVISKFRSVAKLKLWSTTVGSGQLEGLGFYIDDMIQTIDTVDQTQARGMVAPFAYVRVRLVDAATLDVLAEATAKQSSIIAKPSADSSGMEIFVDMTAADKVRHIRSVLEDAMSGVLPAVMEN
jgi:hypothetical protein